jgi:xanthine dehydrogenase accessory factor
MSEVRALVEAARQLRERKESFLSATVVRVRGSGYRRAGARMIANREQWLAGSISGGCLERELVTKGFWLTREQRALMFSYDAEDPIDSGGGSGCRGVIDVLLERHDAECDAADLFVAAERCLHHELSVVSVSVIHSTRPDVTVGARMIVTPDDVQCNRSADVLTRAFKSEADVALSVETAPYISTQHSAQGQVEALIERLAPPPHLFVFGSGYDVTPLTVLAKNLGWTVSVWDALPRTSTRERLLMVDHYLTCSLEHAVEKLARCVCPIAVVMGHHLAQDRAALGALLQSSAAYIGVLGPRQRTNQLLSELRAQGVTPDAATLARVYAPVGLALGAQTPAEIALSILAEAQSALAQTRVVPLRSEPGAIHQARDPQRHEPPADAGK